RRLLEADVVDRRADDHPQRLEPRLLHQQKLVDGQVRGEEPAAELLDALAAMRRHALHRTGVIRGRRALPAAGSRGSHRRTTSPALRLRVLGPRVAVPVAQLTLNLRV